MNYFDYVLDFLNQIFDSFFVSQTLENIFLMETLTFVFALLPLVLVPYAIHRFVMLIVRLKNGY